MVPAKRLEDDMTEDVMDVIEVARGAKEAATPDAKRVLIALATCRTKLDEYLGVQDGGEWESDATINAEMPGEYVLWVIAYAQLLSLVRRDTTLGVALEALLSANSPVGPLAADAAYVSDPTE